MTVQQAFDLVKDWQAGNFILLCIVIAGVIDISSVILRGVVDYLYLIIYVAIKGEAPKKLPFMGERK